MNKLLEKVLPKDPFDGIIFNDKEEKIFQFGIKHGRKNLLSEIKLKLALDEPIIYCNNKHRKNHHESTCVNCKIEKEIIGWNNMAKEQIERFDEPFLKGSKELEKKEVSK